ncbi:MAG: ABC transporter substrate-binding protein [Acetobacteraceae bacterium]
MHALTPLTALAAISLALPLFFAQPADAASCTAKPVTLRFANWASAETATANEVNKAITTFEAANPCVHISSIAIPYNNVVTQLTVMTVGHNTPDVMQLSSGMPDLLAAQGALADLSHYASKEFLADNYPAMLEDGQFKGKQVALPFALTPHGFWFNKALMTKAGLDPNDPPKTITALDHDMAVVKAKLPGIFPFGIMDDKAPYTVVVMWPWLQAYCKVVPMSDQRLGWTQPCVEQAFSWFAMLATKGYTPIGNDIKDNRQLFATGKMVFKIDGPYLRGIISSISPQDAPDQAFAATFGTASVPAGPAGPSRTAIDIHLIAMSAHSAHPEDAWKFLHFMIASPASVKDFLIPQGTIPPLKSSQKAFASMLDQPYQQVWINDIIPSAQPIPYNPKWYHASNFIIDALQAIMNGSPVKPTLARLETNLKEVYPDFKP